MRLVPLAFAALAVEACGNTYHPDYHPVTVTSYSQRVVYPAQGASRDAPGPIFRPPPPTPPPTPAWWSAWPDE